MYRRLTVSFFAEWRKRNTDRKRATLKDFYNLMELDYQRRGFLLVTANRPSFRAPI